MPTDDPRYQAALAAVHDGQRMLTRRELEVLLNEFFVGPIAPATVDRLEAALRGLDAAQRAVAERTLQANKTNYNGQAWREVLSHHKLSPSAKELAAWVAVSTPGYPAPRPYCPPRLVGVWKQVEPRAASWELRADGKLVSDEPRASAWPRWSVHKVDASDDLSGDDLMLRAEGNVHPRMFSIDGTGPSSASLRYADRAGPVTYYLERPATVRTRSSAEMSFAASLEPCPQCGTRELGKLEIHGDTTAWAYTTACPQCGKKRAFKFATTGAPYDVKTKPYELGDGPSTTITAAQFRTELARALPMIDEHPTALAPKAWYASRDALWRAMTCIVELAKLGSNLDAERARLQAILKAYTADGDRIYDLEHP